MRGDGGERPDRHREYTLERTLGVAKRLARCLAGMPGKQAAALIITESPGLVTSYVPTTGPRYGFAPRTMQEGRKRSAVDLDRTHHRATGRGGGTTVHPGGVSG